MYGNLLNCKSATTKIIVNTLFMLDFKQFLCQNSLAVWLFGCLAVWLFGCLAHFLSFLYL